MKMTFTAAPPMAPMIGTASAASLSETTRL